MLQWLAKLFRAGDRRQRARRAPAQTVASAPDTPPPFLRRETMIDRDQQVAAYLLGVDTPGALRAHDWQAATRKFFDDVLIDHFASGRLSGLLGKRVAFLPLSAASLNHPRLAQLPRDNLVIEFSPPPGAQLAVDTILRDLRALDQAGFALACGEDLEARGLAEALALARFISFPRVSALAPPDLLARCHALAQRYPDRLLVAHDVDSVELHQACRRLGMHLFQGRFLTHRELSPSHRIAPYRLFVVQLLNGVRQQVDFPELARIAWRDPALAYRLLRFVNSAAFGLRVKIDDLKQAMTYLGRDELYRWLTLLMFSSREPGQLDDALRENALVRARLAERLGEGRLMPKECEEAFIVGILSVLDALLGVPMADALAQLTLPPPVTEALLHGEGKYAPYLKLAIACEEGDQAEIETLARACGMNAETINLRHIEALTWAMRYSEALRESALAS